MSMSMRCVDITFICDIYRQHAEHGISIRENFVGGA